MDVKLKLLRKWFICYPKIIWRYWDQPRQTLQRASSKETHNQKKHLKLMTAGMQMEDNLKPNTTLIRKHKRWSMSSKGQLNACWFDLCIDAECLHNPCKLNFPFFRHTFSNSKLVLFSLYIKSFPVLYEVIK